MKALKYSDISLVPKYSEVHSRVDCDTSLEIGNHKFKLPIIPANMKSVIDFNMSRWMSYNGYFYIMHRFDRHLADDVGLANSEGWQTISFRTGAKIKDKIQGTESEKLFLDLLKHQDWRYSDLTSKFMLS